MKISSKSQNFQWISEGVPVQKRGKKIRYEAFILGDLKIEIGDFVLVRNDDALDPEDFMSCYVAQVKNLFDTGDEIDPYQAQVQWFSRVLELPTYAIKLIKGAGHELEVVKDKRSSWHDIIDAETIFQKCEVIFLPSDCDFESALSKYKNLLGFNTPVFFCRYIFTGTSLIEVKDNLKVNAVMAFSTNKNSNVNGSISHDEKTAISDMTHVKSKSPGKTRETYCAFSLGSPSKIPRVVIKKIDEKILESRNKNVRIFIADSNVENIEDVANTFLNKLKLEEKNSENKPVIHTLTSQKDNHEKDIIATNIEFMDYDSNIESEASKTPQKLSNTKCSIKLNTKFCKNLFSYNTRNSPKKQPSDKNQNVCTTPTKKPKITMLNDVKFKPSSPKMTYSTDEGILKPRLAKNKHKSLDKQYDTDIAERYKFKNNNICEENGYSDSDVEIDSLSMSFHEDTSSHRLRKNKHKNFEKQSIAGINKFESDDECEENDHSLSDMEIDPLSMSIRTRKSSVSKEIASPVPKSIKKTKINAKKALPNNFAKLENSDSYSAPKKRETQHTKKSSPSKYIKIENSSSYSTPKKTAKFADGFEEFHQTRSGRRVKAVNYTEEKNVTGLISANTPTKKVPRYVHINCSDDSDSDNFTASSGSSDNDDSLSDISSLGEVYPDKTKSQKKKIASKKTGTSLSMQTPKSRKSLINLSIPERKTPLRTPKNALEESRQRLHVSAVPNSLPCRDEEYSDIYSFVKGCLCAQTGGCMYISGVPGTGKTATVHEVIRNLEEEKELGEVPIFNFVEVNGMWMTDPYQCYVQIFKSLTGKGIAPQQAADLLEKRFTERGPKKDAVVLLVDELDRLWTRKQTVMYNLFDWPSKKNSKLIVIAIANTMDLPERMMMNRISSRLGLTRKTFQPYTFKQLQEIIMSRIQELKVFDPDAVQLVARKVAAVSGDARRALDICRFATETVKVGQTVKKGQKILVGMEHVDKALQQMFSSPVISAIRSSSKIVKIFFHCILSEFTRSGLEETTLLKVHRQVISTCRFEGLNPPNSTEISRICADLAASHLILVDNFKNDLYMKIRLNISSDDVTYALTLK